MASGVVKWFSKHKGYGFIQPEEGGNDVFVHISAVEAVGQETLREGDRIEYDLVEHKGRTNAANLRIA